MEPVIGITALFVFGGLLHYTVTEQKHRDRWRRYERRPIDPAASPFRRDPGPAPTRELLVQRRAPVSIRRTALWSIYMGQMAIPGGLLGLFGLLASGLGLVSIPGLILALRIWRHGFALLRRDPGAEREARRLHRFAVRLNVVAIGIGLVLLATIGGEMAGVTLVLVGYGAVSFAHAAALRRCAELLAADRELRIVHSGVAQDLHVAA